MFLTRFCRRKCRIPQGSGIFCRTARKKNYCGGKLTDPGAVGALPGSSILVRCTVA